MKPKDDLKKWRNAKIEDKERVIISHKELSHSCFYGIHLGCKLTDCSCVCHHKNKIKQQIAQEIFEDIDDWINTFYEYSSKNPESRGYGDFVALRKIKQRYLGDKK